MHDRQMLQFHKPLKFVPWIFENNSFLSTQVLDICSILITDEWVASTVVFLKCTLHCAFSKHYYNFCLGRNFLDEHNIIISIINVNGTFQVSAYGKSTFPLSTSCPTRKPQPLKNA